jgi:hypothetical protein
MSGSHIEPHLRWLSGGGDELGHAVVERAVERAAWMSDTAPSPVGPPRHVLVAHTGRSANLRWSADGAALRERFHQCRDDGPEPRAELWQQGPLTAVTEVELVMSCDYSGGADGQAGLGEATIHEGAAVLELRLTGRCHRSGVYKVGDGRTGRM